MFCSSFPFVGCFSLGRQCGAVPASPPGVLPFFPLNVGEPPRPWSCCCWSPTRPSPRLIRVYKQLYVSDSSPALGSFGCARPSVCVFALTSSALLPWGVFLSSYCCCGGKLEPVFPQIPSLPPLPHPFRDRLCPPVLTGALSCVWDSVSCFRRLDGSRVCLWASLSLFSVADLPPGPPRVRFGETLSCSSPEVPEKSFLPLVAPLPRTQSQELF